MNKKQYRGDHGDNVNHQLIGRIDRVDEGYNSGFLNGGDISRKDTIYVQ